ncbi:MAG TPA: hypothetical protein VI136_25505 [Verrucomicrobiae bacterium]
MRTFRILWFTTLLGLGFGCQKAPPPAPPAPPPKPDVLVRVHFAGAELFHSTTNAGALKTILALPESSNLLHQTLGKLARAPYTRFQAQLGDQTNDCAELLRPLLDDLTQAESCFEMGVLSNQPPEWALAVRVPAVQAEIWRTNLAATVAAFTGIQPTNRATGNPQGWVLWKHDAPNLFALTLAGDWVVLGAGHNELRLQTGMVERIQTRQRPTDAITNYLHAVVDWPRLAGQPQWLAALRLPKMDVTVEAKGENLQTKIEMTLPAPLDWKAEPWHFPTNTIREPVVSFSAMQGFGDRLKPLLQLLGWKADAIPNQLCTWSLAEIPFQTFAAFPAPDATNLMAHLCDTLPPLFNSNSQGRALGTWRTSTNKDAIVWGDMPFFGGFLGVAHEETNSGFILGGLFPNTPKRIPPPPELYFQVLGRTNLAYYDWEIGAERLLAWRNMCQLALLLAEKPQLERESATMKWMEAVAPTLGNIGTSITVNAPDQMTFLRLSPFGFTSLETVLLANWLESVTFPWGYELPAPPKPKRKSAAAKPNP